MLDRKKVAGAINAMAENFRDTIHPGTLSLWLSLLDEAKVTTEEVFAGVKRLLLKRKISCMPTFAEFFEAIRPEANENLDDLARIQADIVLSAIKRTQIRPKFEDPITDMLIGLVWPWSNLLMMEKSETRYWRRDFIEAYKVYSCKKYREMLYKGTKMLPAKAEGEKGKR